MPLKEAFKYKKEEVKLSFQLIMGRKLQGQVSPDMTELSISIYLSLFLTLSPIRFQSDSYTLTPHTLTSTSLLSLWKTN